MISKLYEINNLRNTYYMGKFYEMREILYSKADGEHCIICNEKLNGRQKYYCDDWECKYFLTRYILSWTDVRAMRLVLDDFKCQRCGKPHTDDEPLDIHHIIPVKQGGCDHPSNLTSLCRSCHKSVHGKNDKPNNNFKLNDFSD